MDDATKAKVEDRLNSLTLVMLDTYKHAMITGETRDKIKAADSVSEIVGLRGKASKEAAQPLQLNFNLTTDQLGDVLHGLKRLNSPPTAEESAPRLVGESVLRGEVEIIE